MEPMMTIDDQRQLIATIEHAPDDALFVEFGGGGSTLMFARHMRNDQRLITIEHNPEWYAKIKSALVDGDPANRVSVYLRTPEAEPTFYPFGHPYEEVPVACDAYIHTDNIPISWRNVYAVLVDGFVRGAVLSVLRGRLATDTLVFLHDYTGREPWYDWAVRLYDIVAIPSGASPDRIERGQPLPNSLLRLRVP